MKSIAMNGLTAIDEAERRILQLVDESNPNYAVKLLDLVKELSKIKEGLSKFDQANKIKTDIDLDQFKTICTSYGLECSEPIYRMFLDQVSEKQKYINELEGILSSDPDLVVDDVTKLYWRHSAVKYAKKLENRIKELESKIKN